jgi:pimeloyl-ACP methyl ester carboxylesterase
MKRQIDDGNAIEYDKRGNGTPLVLLHAFPMNNAMWRGQIDFLAREFKVIAPNLRGIGTTSPFPSAPSVEQMAHDVATLLADMNLAQPTILCGLSMGGYVALAFARLYPQRLGALVLCDTQAAPDSPEARAKREENIAFAQIHSSSELLERMLPALLGETTRATRPKVVEAVRQMAHDLEPQALVQLLQALRDRPDATPHLGQIKVPTLILCGLEDSITPPEVAKLLAHSIPHAELHLIPQAGHLSNLERPQDFNKHLMAFLRSL